MPPYDRIALIGNGVASMKTSIFVTSVIPVLMAAAGLSSAQANAQQDCLSEVRRVTRNVDGRRLYDVYLANKCSNTVNVETCGTEAGSCSVIELKGNTTGRVWIADIP